MSMIDLTNVIHMYTLLKGRWRSGLCVLNSERESVPVPPLPVLLGPPPRGAISFARDQAMFLFWQDATKVFTASVAGSWVLAGQREFGSTAPQYCP